MNKIFTLDYLPMFEQDLKEARDYIAKNRPAEYMKEQIEKI